MFTFFASNKPYFPNSFVSVEATLSDQPKLAADGQKVSINLPNAQRVSVKFEAAPILSYGDRIKFEGKISYFKTDKGNEVAYMTYPKFKIIEKGENSLIVNVRENIIHIFNSSLGNREAALMLGIVFGIKEQMPDEFYSQLQKTGVLHVIAASGMNITMVGGFLISIFSLFFKRQFALSLTIVGILLYSLLAGFEASIVRAAIMGILVFGAQILGRQQSASIGFFTAGFIMLFVNPTLINDIGFQLSFMATFGLIYVRPIFELNKKVKKLIEKTVIGEDVATTITAQAVTLPILLGNFGTYGLFSILVNALVLWTVPIIMIIGGVSAIVGLLFLPIGKLISYFSLPFLLYFEKIIGLFSNFGGQISIESLPLTLIGGYYLILLSLILYLRKR